MESCSPHGRAIPERLAVAARILWCWGVADATAAALARGKMAAGNSQGKGRAAKRAEKVVVDCIGE